MARLARIVVDALVSVTPVLFRVSDFAALVAPEAAGE